MSKRNPLSFRPSVVQLESREVPAVTSVTLVNGIVTATCNNVSSTVVVSQQNPSFVSVRDVGSGKVWSFSAAQVKRVDVFGGAGNDTFTVSGNVTVGIRLYGGDGNDTMAGGTGRDNMIGGNG